MAPADIARINEVADHNERIDIGRRAVAALYAANRKIDNLERAVGSLKAAHLHEVAARRDAEQRGAIVEEKLREARNTVRCLETRLAEVMEEADELRHRLEVDRY